QPLPRNTKAATKDRFTKRHRNTEKKTFSVSLCLFVKKSLHSRRGRRSHKSTWHTHKKQNPAAAGLLRACSLSYFFLPACCDKRSVAIMKLSNRFSAIANQPIW